jgi:glutamine cyclotransferase
VLFSAAGPTAPSQGASSCQLGHGSHSAFGSTLPLLGEAIGEPLTCEPPALDRNGQSVAPPAAAIPYEVLGSYPHDPEAFLQGLVWHDGGFYESTGLHGRSSLRRVAFPSGEVLQQVALPEQYFGEGLALVGDRLVQLTWRSKRGLVYDHITFGLLGDFTYETEGWGLTYDGESLIMSNGSDVLTFLDPDSYQPVRTLAVTLDGRRLRALNELEWIEGEIWANVWQTDQVVRIDPVTGRATGVLDLSGLLPSNLRTGREDVLNGIAYDPTGKRIFVSGKLWPVLFEIRVP